MMAIYVDKLPLLARITMAETVEAAARILVDEPGWPPGSEAARNRLRQASDKTGRDFALYEVSTAIGDGQKSEIRCAAQVLMARPHDVLSCGRGLKLVHLDAFPTVVMGWARLADGWWADDLDVLVAARATLAADLPPSKQEADRARLIDDWWVEDGRLSGTYDVCVITGDCSWARCRDGQLLMLGSVRSDAPVIVRAALCDNWTSAHNAVASATGRHTLPSNVLMAVYAAESKLASFGERRRACLGVALHLRAASRPHLAGAWEMLAADATKEDDAARVVGSLEAAEVGATYGRKTIFEKTLEWWKACACGLHKLRVINDAFAACAASIGPPPETTAEKTAEPKTDDDDIPGIVVLPALGGTTKTSSGREVKAEFADIVGKKLALEPAPPLGPVRAVLFDEFPHLAGVIDALLAGMVEGQPIRWRHLLLAGPAGTGKTRLCRRMAELLGIGLHRFDAAGSSDNAFGGTPRRWSTGEHCTPLEAVRRYMIANPLVLVDEVDKSGKSYWNGSLDKALLPFLENESARNFPDPYVQSNCNLSGVGYFMTANDTTLIGSTLRDRLRVIRFDEPKAEHLPALARTIVADIGAESGDARWYPPLSDGELLVAETLWRGGSIRRLRGIVELILAYRESSARQ